MTVSSTNATTATDPPQANLAQPASQVMGPAAIRAYTGEKLNGKNWSAFEFGFKAHLIGYNLVDALKADIEDKAIQNKVFSILIAALESSQFI